MGYFYRVVFIVLLASYVCGEINEDNEDSNVLERMMWRQSTDVGELLADVKALIMGQEQQIQQLQELQQQMIQQLQEFQQQMQPLLDSHQRALEKQQRIQKELEEQQRIQKELEEQQRIQKELEEQQRIQIGCKTTKKGREYTGTLAVTKSGKTCLRWDSKTWGYTAYYFPDATIAEAANYCRNPGGRLSGGPWCWLTYSSYEYCDVPFCQWCKTTKKGREYTGTLAVTKSGKTCKRWDWYSFSASSFPDATLAAAANYCRNPTNRSGGPWCCLTDSCSSWGYCDVTFCL